MSFRHLCGSYHNMTPEARFSEYVMPVTESGCHIYMGEESHNGYGRFRIEGTKRTPAHRYAWMLAHGEIPSGLMVCHKCDTPQCVNVSHLFLGTCKQNKADSIKKGRHSHGKVSSLARATLVTPQLAMEVFNALGTHQAIADQVGLKRQTVTKIKAKKSWAWIHGD